MTQMTHMKQSDFSTYEYKEVHADPERLAFYLDCYENFGWYPDEHFQIRTRDSILHLKRNRKLVNKTELTRLQRQFEACIAEIRALEKSRNTAALTASMVVGLIGTAFIAGSVFAVTAEPPRIRLCILLAIPGFLGWLLGYFLYEKVRNWRDKVIRPYVEEKYNEIDTICEKGHSLL